MEGSIWRSRLTDALLAQRPIRALFIAPPGFGKTTLARQIATKFRRVAVCDCSSATTAERLAQALLSALALESPERAPVLDEQRFSLNHRYDGYTDLRHGLSRAWSEPPEPSLFVIDNVETIVEHGLFNALGHLLRGTPEERSLILCSRLEPPGEPLYELICDQRAQLLAARDLAFTEAETQELLRRYNLGADVSEDVFGTARGWPIVTVLLARAAAQRGLGKLQEDLALVDYGELYGYLADTVLNTIHGPALRMLLTCAFLPRTDDRDLRIALDFDHEPILRDLVAKTPFIYRADDGHYEVHIALRLAVEAKYKGQREDILRTAATRLQHAKRYERAARALVALDDHDAAAETLELISPLDPIRLYRAIENSGLNGNVVQRHPRLWASQAWSLRDGTTTTQVAAKALDIIRSLPAGADPDERASLYVLTLACMFSSGRIDDVTSLLASADAIAAQESANEQLAYALRGARALVHARRGRFHDAWPTLLEGLSVLNGSPNVLRAFLCHELAAMARTAGDRFGDEHYLQLALEAISGVVVPLISFSIYAEALFSAWFHGDDSQVDRLADSLSGDIERLQWERSFMLAALRDEPFPERKPTRPRALAYAHLIAATRTNGSRGDHAREAIEVARLATIPLAEVLGHVALALIDESDRDVSLRMARSRAAQLDSPNLIAALDSMIAGGDPGMLQAFVARFERRRARGNIHVSIATQTASLDGNDVELSAQELALLAYMVLTHGSRTPEQLCDAIWPNAEAHLARAALNSCLYRLRRKTRSDIVVRDHRGYRLGDDVHIDLGLYERRGADSPPSVDAVVTMLRRPTSFLSQYEWFDDVDMRLQAIGAKMKRELLSRSFDDGNFEQSERDAHAILIVDPCDDYAAEIAIRSALALGRQRDAHETLRLHQQALRQQLNTEVPRRLYELFEVPS